MAFRTDGEEQASNCMVKRRIVADPILGTSNKQGNEASFYHVSVLQQIDQ